MVRVFLISVLCVLSTACASVLAPLVTPSINTDTAALRDGAYGLDSDHASLIFKIDHLGFSTFVGRFERFDASLDFDTGAPAAARVDAFIDMTSLDIANDEFAETLMGPEWFDVGAFPQALFRTTAIDITGDNSGVLVGDLTLHGVTQSVRLDVVFNGGTRDRLRGGAYAVGFSARGQFSRKAFGVDRFDGLIPDDVMIEIEAEFLRQ